MIFLRKLLLPFAILYGLITSIRNYMYDKALLRSFSFNIPIIAIGNLSVGGTGKTPQIEYLIRLLNQKYSVATLSRGYKRKSSGFVLADEKSTAKELGDEPFQFYSKFGNIQVAVDADRKNGILNLLSQNQKPSVILLDDAFQHRKVKAGLYVLLTSYNNLYIDDFILPTGNLREIRRGSRRANIIIVTKCPSKLSAVEQSKIVARLNIRPHQKLFFTTVTYDEFVYSERSKLAVCNLINKPKVLLSGIANPTGFYSYLQTTGDELLTYPDHYNFSTKDIKLISSILKNKIIITTEKDYVRLKGRITSENLYYLPIKTEFISRANTFEEIILKYISGVS